MVKKFIKLSFGLFCLAIFWQPIFAQDLSKKEINLYVKKIDKLKSQKKLNKYFYPNKSRLGALKGFYLENKLAYMEAVDGGDTLENRYYIYLKDDKIYKAIIEHFKYSKEYVETGKNYRLLFAEKAEIFYSKDLTDHYLLKASRSCIEDLSREKVLEK